MSRYESWGRYPPARPWAVHRVSWRDDAFPERFGAGACFLPYGNGRSYGDVCLNDGGIVLDARGLDRMIAFDVTRGILRCEAGVLLETVIALALPRGWFLPVTPGTRRVTVGGAVANDVHGKNHHRVGSFGCHVRRLELLRSDGRRLMCGPDEHSEMLRATIGGLGLTGLILWVELQLRAVSSRRLRVERTPFDSLEEFLARTEGDEARFEHSVAWIDALARGPRRDRGVLFRANHLEDEALPRAVTFGAEVTVPFTAPGAMMGERAMRAFNTLYRWRHARARSDVVDLLRFFYPLDRLRDWYRLYGPRGLLQHQCVVPVESAAGALGAMLRAGADAGEGSFLAVLKRFGAHAAPGLLSFARPGVTLAVDFPHRGEGTLRLVDRLCAITADAGGATYPAKDARMSGAQFRRAFPAWERLAGLADPRFSSGLWRRVTR